MVVTKRNINKEKTEDVNKTSTSPSTSKDKVEISSKQCNNCQSCRGCQLLKSISITVLTAFLVITCTLLYVKRFNPDLYSKRVEVLFPSTHTSSSILKEATTTPVTNTNSKTNGDSKNVKRAFDFSQIEEFINLEEKAFLKDILKEETIYEKLKDKPELLKIHYYYEEPIGQLVRRLSLESQIVIFINSNDERSKVTRLAISQVKVPYGIIEVDNEPRGSEMREALFRMTSQRTFPFIFVNGKFFGNSFYLQKTMKNGEFYKLVDSEENKAEWLKLKEEYKEKIEKRKEKELDRRQKRFEKIMKKIEEGKKEKANKKAD